MATTIKTSKKDIITNLEKKNEELQIENDNLQMENDELKAELEELKANQEEMLEKMKEEVMAEVMEKLKKKKEPKKKEPEYFEGNLQEYTELNKDLITKKELLDWVKNPEEVKNICMTKQKNTTEKTTRTQKEGNICYARVFNDGKGGRCNNTARDNKWCYCSQHNKQYNERKLKHGDTRITGEGSIPLYKAFEKRLDYTGDMVCEEIDGEEWLAGF